MIEKDKQLLLFLQLKDYYKKKEREIKDKMISEREDKKKFEELYNELKRLKLESERLERIMYEELKKEKS
jgi:hypothetical protein